MLQSNSPKEFNSINPFNGNFREPEAEFSIRWQSEKIEQTKIIVWAMSNANIKELIVQIESDFKK